MTDDDKKEPLLKYFDLGNAYKDAELEFTVGSNADKAKAGAKLLGKAVFNMGLFAGKLGVEFVKRAPDIAVANARRTIEDNPNMSDEQRKKCESVIERGEDISERREQRQERQEQRREQMREKQEQMQEQMRGK